LIIFYKKLTEIALFFSKSYIFTLFQEPKLGGISVVDNSEVHTPAILLLLIVENIEQLRHAVSFQGYNTYRAFCQNQVEEFGGEKTDSMAIS
jgi:hypothetical protein